MANTAQESGPGLPECHTRVVKHRAAHKSQQALEHCCKRQKEGHMIAFEFREPFFPLAAWQGEGEMSKQRGQNTALVV